jgi:hypothetical protein
MLCNVYVKGTDHQEDKVIKQRKKILIIYPTMLYSIANN